MLTVREIVVIAVVLETGLIYLYIRVRRMERQRRQQRRARRFEKPRQRPDVGPDLLGNECQHTYDHRYRGYMMCSQQMCAALCNMDGTALTRNQRQALTQQLKKDYEE